ncbi:DUF4402 domain-containing protein [Rickettsiales bacterium LUAb2]
MLNKKAFIFLGLCLVLILISTKHVIANANNNIIINQPMYFGKITYDKQPLYYRINDNNLLQSLNNSSYNNYSSQIAIITVYGQPNELVSLTFSGGQLTGNGQIVNVNNIQVFNSSNNIQLDNTGKATLKVTGVLNINSNSLIGKFVGNTTVLANYKSQNVSVSQNIPITVDLAALQDATVSNLSFGTIIKPKTGSCTATVNLDGTMTSNCPEVGGNIMANVFTVTSLIGVLLNLIVLPTSATLTGPNGATLTATNFTKAVAGAGLLTYKITIGATLTVPSTTPSGTYTGTYNVNILL